MTWIVVSANCSRIDSLSMWIALLVLTAPPRTEGYEKLQPLAVVGQQRFAESLG